MLRNHLKIAWRNALKNRMYSVIITVGLTIGLWACMSVTTVVVDDLSYDTQWTKSDRIYRINTLGMRGGGQSDKIPQTWVGMRTELMKNFPEVEDITGIHQAELDLKLATNDSEVIQAAVLETDTSIWNVLDFSILSGAPKQFVEGHPNVVVSESFHEKYFPSKNPVGKTIYQIPRYGNKPKEYEITGIVKDIPSNTHLRADILLIDKPRTEPLFGKQYGSMNTYYMVLKAGTSIAEFTSKVNSWYADHVEVEDPYTFEFQPIEDVYLHSDFAQGQQIKGNYTTILVLSGITLLLLLIACINFVNLTTARTVHRMNEIGVRKILGAGKRTIVFQFLAESVLYFLAATLMGLVLYIFLLPYIEQFLGHSLSKTFTSGLSLILWVVLIILPISLLSGVYPALVISRMNPTAAISGVVSSRKGIKSGFLQKGLVVLQFSISIAVLIALIIVQQQVHFLNHKDIGYNKDNLLAIEFVSWDGKGSAFKEELLKRPSVKSTSISHWIPGSGPGFMVKTIDDPNNEGEKIDVWYIKGDVDLPKTLGLELQKGRLFDKTYQNDYLPWENPRFTADGELIQTETIRSAIITDYTAKALQATTLNTPVEGTQTNLVGIVADFNSESLKNTLQPTIIVSEKSPKYGGMLVRVNPGQGNKILADIHEVWGEFYPDKALNVHWVDDMLNQQYVEESKLRQLFSFFSLLTMFLASLGILGLVEHSIARRVKEVGIRKVLGASINSIVILFSKNFIKLIIVAVVIATPIAWYGMQRWLENFAYQIDIGWWVFLSAGLITILIAMITLGFQTFKAAMANPAEALQSE